MAGENGERGNEIPPLSIAALSSSFIRKTGQERWFRVSRTVVIAGGACMVAGQLTIDAAYGVWLVLVGTLVGVTGFVWNCLSVTCPQCGVSVVWHTLRTRSASQAMWAVRLQSECPSCGFSPSHSPSE